MTDIRHVLSAAESMDNVLGATVGANMEMMAASIKRLEQRMLTAMKDLTTNNRGHLVGPRVNLKQAQQMHKDMVNMFEEEFGKGARRAVNGFNAVAEEIMKNFKSLDVAATFTRVDKDMITALRAQALQEYEQFGLAAQDKIATTMYDTVVAKGSWAELTATVSGILSGGKDARGLSLAAYTDTWANDAVMNFHQQVHLKKARDAGLVMFLYYGNIIGQSRPFCIDRAGKVFSQKVIESWNGLTWQGKSGPPLTRRGGYNCRHHWQPVKKEWIPEDAIEVGDYFDETGKKIKRGTPPTGPKTPAPKPKPKPTPKAKITPAKKLPGGITYVAGKTMEDAHKFTQHALSSPLATSPNKYIKIGTGMDKGAYYFRFDHNDWPGFSYHGLTQKQKTALIHRKARIGKSFEKDTVEGINWKLAELQNRSARLGLPPLRAINALNASQMKKANVMASMGDGVLTFNAKSFNRYFAGWVDEVKHYDEKCRQFMKQGNELLPRIEKQFGKRSAQYRVLKEQIDMRAAELTRIKEGTWTGPAFGGGTEEISKWRPKVGGSKVPHGSMKPHNADAYFDNQIERGYVTMDHEYAHHIHQQLFVSSRYSAGNPELEQWLVTQFAKTNTAFNATRYAVKSEFAREGKEWFAENYSLWKNGRKGLVDPRLRGLMERLDDLEVGKITRAQLHDMLFYRPKTPAQIKALIAEEAAGKITKKELNDALLAQARDKHLLPKVRGTYDISKTLSYTTNELQVIHALEKAGGMGSSVTVADYIDWDKWEGVKGSPLVESAMRSLRTKGVVRHDNMAHRWTFHMVDDAVLKGSPARGTKKWGVQRLRYELDKDEIFILKQLDGYDGPVRFTDFDADFGMYVDSLFDTMRSLETKGLVRKWWHTPGKVRKKMFDVTDIVDRKDIRKL